MAGLGRFRSQWVKESRCANSARLLADLFLHTFHSAVYYVFKTIKPDITKAVAFSNTFRYIDDLFSVNITRLSDLLSPIFTPQSWN